ncbi:MAG TPA: GAP family protein [Candidatus Bipolaricaulota bacterium]|nr:GAP family protein [Candidatus Bipolaricaulota bacterium]
MFDSLTISTVLGAAAIDSINPCAIAVLVFLLTFLSVLKKPKQMLSVGLVYIFFVYLTYFLAGIGLMAALGLASNTLTITIYRLSAVLLIFLGLINIKDFFWYGKGLSLSIPESKKPLIEKYVRKASLPAAIVLGVLVSAFELPCTGGVYIAILSLLAVNASYLNGVLYLLLYNLIFVLPLIIILMLVYFGYSSKKLEELRKKSRSWLRLIIGLAMLVFGIMILTGII